MAKSSFYSDGGTTATNVSSITSLTNEATASKDAAKVSEDAAAASATASANSATASENSANSITGSVTSAQAAQTAAEAALATTITHKNTATTQASSATSSAATATTKAAEAATSATNAATSEANSLTNKNAAETSKNSAATSATNAATSASTSSAQAAIATNKATDAQKLAVNAEDSQFTLSDGSTTGYSALHYNAKAEDEKTAAAASASTSSAQATIATTKAGEASTSAASAASSASTASTQASNSATSASAANTAKVAAEAALDQFTDVYLGAFSSDPTVDNDGDALTVGDQYFNTTSNVLKIYNGSSWQAAALDSTGFVEVAGDTMTGNLSFGDNDKAIFGAGSDLQIYHDGSNSFIRDAGTGNLVIRGTSLNLQKDGGESYITMVADGAVTLYYDNSPKLATTNTGADITGTLTSDGLTVDGNNGVTISGDYPFINFGETDTTDENSRVRVSAGDFRIDTVDNSYASGKTRFLMDNATGDISFYEDTGTTPKFFWDASYESLDIGSGLSEGVKNFGTNTKLGLAGSIILEPGSGNEVDIFNYRTTNLNLGTGGSADLTIDSVGNVGIGTSSPNLHGWSKAVTLDTTTNAGYELGQSGTKYGAFALQGDGRVQLTNFTANPLTFQTNNTERMRIDSSGNVGIGTSSPDSGYKLDVAGNVVFGDGGGFDMNVDGTRWQFSLAGSEKMRIDSVGNVGIGTASPSDYYADNLVVNAQNEGGITLIGTSAHENYLAWADGTSGTDRYSGYLSYNHSSNFMRFATNGGAEAMRIDSSGKLLIGDSTSHTADLLQIETPASGGGHGIQIRRNDSNTDQNVGSITFGNNTATDLASVSAKTDGATDNAALLFKTSVSGGANTERMRIDSLGNVGIGEVPQTDLNTSYDHLQIGKPANIMGSDTAGGLWLNSGTFFNSANNWEYLVSSETVSSLTMTNNIPFRFRYAAAGTAGNTFSWSEAMRIDSSGNVGIGTSSPSAPLQVQGSAGEIRLQRPTASQADWSFKLPSSGGELTFYDNNNSSERMRIDSSGNTTFNGNIIGSDELQLLQPNGTNNFGMELNNSHQVKYKARGSGGTHIFTNTNSDTERMRIDSSGNVGIGTTSVDELLHLEKSAGTTIVKTEVAANSTVGFEIKKTNATTSNWRIVDGQTVNGKLEIYDVTNSRNVMTFDQSGNVGVGTASPQDKIQVESGDIKITHATGSTFRGIQFGATAADNQNYSSLLWKASTGEFRLSANPASFGGFMSFHSNAAEAMRIDSSGNLLVGTSSGATNSAGIRLYNAGGTLASSNWVKTLTGTHNAIRFYHNGSNVGNIQYSDTATSYLTSSDYRLKENVVELTGATTRLKQLEPKRFNFIADADTTVDGFIAHEVQSVVPEAITGTHNEVDDDGNPVYQGIDQSKLVPLLVKTIQELEARITTLEGKI